jgi:hypothetical protein
MMMAWAFVANRDGKIPNRVGGGAGEKGLWRRCLGMVERLRRPRVL